MASNPNIVDSLRQQKFYAGQIDRLTHTEDKPERSYLVAESLARIKDATGEAKRTPLDLPLLALICSTVGMERLYGHQEQVLKSVLLGRDAILATGEGSGRSTAADALAIYTALGASDNVLVLCPTELAAGRRLAALALSIQRTGLDYAAKVVPLLGGTHDQAIPEIVVGTPQQLAALLERGESRGLPSVFFGALSLVIAEDIHQCTGIYGTWVATMCRCVNVLCARYGSRPVILATSAPYANVRDFAQKLFNRDLGSADLISEDCAGAVRKPVVFWRAPMVRSDEIDGTYQRKDLLKDLEDLLKFLTDDGGTHGSRQRLFLLDRSGSMATGDQLQTLKSMVEQDIKERTLSHSKDETAAVYFFNDKLGECCFDGPVATWDEAAAKAFAAVEPAGGTQIGGALSELLDRVIAKAQGPEKLPGEITLFVYSDGADPSGDADRNSIAGKVAQIRDTGIELCVVYVSMGIEPHPSVRAMIEGIGGVVVASAELLTPEQILKAIRAHAAGVLVLSHSDALAGNDLTTRGTARHPVVFRPALNFPGLQAAIPDYPSEEAIRSAEYVVVVGWAGSPELLMHYLRHAGASNATIFVVSVPDPVSRLVVRQWDWLLGGTGNTSRVPDRLMLTPCCDAIGMRAMISLARYESCLSVDEACRLVWGEVGVDDEHRDRLAALTAKAGGALRLVGSAWVAAEADKEYPIPVEASFHMVEKPLWLHMDGARELVVDSSMGLTQFYPGSMTIVNGRRFEVSVQPGGNSAVAGIHLRLIPLPAGRGLWTSPKMVLAPVFPKESLAGSKPSTITGTKLAASLCRVTAELQVSQNGYVRFAGGRADARPQDHKEETGANPLRITTDLLIVTLKLPVKLESGVKAGIENIFWNLLRALTGSPGSVFCLADKDNDRFFLGDITPSDTGTVDTLMAEGGVLLGLVLQFGGLLLRSCPCEESLAMELYNQALREGGQPSLGFEPGTAADMGCGYCLRAAGKSWGLGEETARKKPTLEFLGQAGLVDEAVWSAEMADKYTGVVRDDRLTTARTGMSLGYIGEIVRIMRDKLGAAITDETLADCRFFNEEERAEHEGSLGIYVPLATGRGRVRLVSGLPEFLVIDVLSHEYGHNWAHVVCGAGYGWRFKYDDENVLREGNELFRGRLFVEGTAVWIESHVTDFFANRQRLTRDGLRSGNEYFEGFKLFKYVEQNFGLSAVLKMMIQGVLPEKDSKEMSIDTLLRDSGVNGSIQAGGTQAINDGRLACLRSRWLARPEHLVSLSAFLAGDQEAKPFPDMTAQGSISRADIKKRLREKGVYSLEDLIKKVPGVREFVAREMPGCLDESAPLAAAMRLEIACHLHSKDGVTRRSLWDGIVRIVEKHIDQ